MTTYHIPVDLDDLADKIAARLNGDYVLPRLMNIGQAARYLGRSTSGVRTLLHRGALTRVGTDSNRVMLDRIDLDRWIAERKR